MSVISLNATEQEASERGGTANSLPLRATSRSRSTLVIGVLAVALPVVLLIPLSVQAWNQDIASWDFRLSQRIHAYENRETVLDRWANPLDIALDPELQILGLLVVAGVTLTLFAQGERRLALFVLAGVVGATILGALLKEIFARPPVDPSSEVRVGYEFPSGHALRSMAAAVAIGVVAWPLGWRWPVATAGVLIVLVIGIAVLYHEWHLVADVLGGWCVAVAWLGGLWLLLRPRGRSRRSTQYGQSTT